MRNIPNTLKKGDTVAIIAPSWSMSVVNLDILDNIEQYFSKLWIYVVYGKHAKNNHFWNGGTIQERVDDIMDAFRDHNIKAIIPIFGGFSSNQLIPYLDYEIIKANPKLFIGYSDITALHIAIWSQTGLVTYVWPWWTQLWHYFPSEYTLISFEEMCCTTQDIYIISPAKTWTEWMRWRDKKHDTRQHTHNIGWDIVRSWKAEWIAFWWNLSTLALLIGTEYWKIPPNPILFLEECGDLSEGWIMRVLEQLYQVGFFDNAQAIVFWRFETASYITREYLIENLYRYTNKNIPIILNADFGHTEPMMTIPIGVYTIINTEKSEICFQMTK